MSHLIAEIKGFTKAIRIPHLFGIVVNWAEIFDGRLGVQLEIALDCVVTLDLRSELANTYIRRISTPSVLPLLHYSRSSQTATSELPLSLSPLPHPAAFHVAARRSFSW